MVADGTCAFRQARLPKTMLESSKIVIKSYAQEVFKSSILILADIALFQPNKGKTRRIHTVLLFQLLICIKYDNGIGKARCQGLRYWANDKSRPNNRLIFLQVDSQKSTRSGGRCRI